MDTILDWLDRSAREYGNRIVYTDGSDKITFKGLREAAALIGAAVAGIEKTERPVAVLTGRHVYTPACYLGIAMAGCFYAPMDPTVPEARLMQILDVVRADTLITDREHAAMPGQLGYTGKVIVLEDVLHRDDNDTGMKSVGNAPDANNSDIALNIISDDSETGSGGDSRMVANPSCGFENTKHENLLAERRAAITENTPLYVLFTSGSTGRPKGVLTSHQAMMCYLDGLQQVIGLDESDVLGNQAPLDYIAAIRDLYLPLMTGARTVMLHPNEFAMPQRLMESLSDAGVTTLCWSATGLEIPARLGVFDEIASAVGKAGSSLDDDGGHRDIVPSDGVRSSQRSATRDAGSLDNALSGDNSDAVLILPPLKRVVFSGSVISNPLLRKWQRAFTDTVFINQYGPTEATGSCTYHVLDHVVSDDEVIPIGKPYSHYNIVLLAETDNQEADDSTDNIPNYNKHPKTREISSSGIEVTTGSEAAIVAGTGAMSNDRRMTDVDETGVLDSAVRAATAGEVGEICVKGPALALGYYDSPEQTNRNFALNPLQKHWQERLYRTGDLGRMDENGVLYFLGRKDRQFKHLGHRIEPEEIEQKAASLSGVRECSCAYDQERKIIYLFYAGEATSREIALSLRRDLPSFMVPRKIVNMDELPHLPNGKLDRRALESQMQ